jgi:hypothetical protein
MVRGTPSRIRWAHLLVAAALLALGGGTDRGSEVAAQSATWGFQIEWNQPGGGDFGIQYRLCEGENCRSLAAYRASGTRWRAPLPVYPAGEHRLQLVACNNLGCTPGTPDIFIRVLDASGRRPPIDVLEGPRIPVGR